MRDNDCNDTLSCRDGEDMTAKQLLRDLVTALEHLAKSEGAEAIERAHSKARELLAKLEPLIARSATARTNLEEKVRQQPLLAIGLATAAGFLLASLRRC
jgi:ElaB/YqjD/DUF883 family membrane-anchored ribosome-binding protein